MQVLQAVISAVSQGLRFIVLTWSLLAGATEQQLQDAWWTGPLLASSAATLPAGHLLFEPYVFDVKTNAAFDSEGRRHAVANQHFVGNLSYLLFGITDDVTAGFIPRTAFEQSGGGAARGGANIGDLTAHAGYRLSRFDRSALRPDVSIVLEETLPSGKYDRLTDSNGGTGAGVLTTALALYSQYYFWLPTGRILRARFDVTYSHSESANVHGLSVYGTPDGFRGRARPGDAFDVDLSGEYSLGRRWVAALDVLYHATTRTQVDGTQPRATAVGSERWHQSYGSAHQIGFAPAIECNFTARVGVIAGLRIFELSRNSAGSITSVAALNMVF